MYRPFNPIAKPILVPITQAIRNERMHLDDEEWDTGVRPSPWYLNWLLQEQERGVTQIFKDWELV